MSNCDKYVCVECIRDEDLQVVVRDNLESKQCSYCGESDDELIAAQIETVAEHVWRCVSEEYDNPVNELPYDGKEGGWQCASVYDSAELLRDVFELEIENESLFSDIVSAAPEDEWTHRDWAILEPHQRKASGWEIFKKAIKHKRRFTFWNMDDSTEESYHPDYLPVSKMLEEIGASIQNAGLIKSFPAGSGFWRVRIHGIAQGLIRDCELCTPPIALATQPNRMSPGGIPMFYGAEELNTAVDETFDPVRKDGKVITAACFLACRDLKILDLIDLPHMPGFFNLGTGDIRETLIFLRQFSHDLSKPIPRDGREHIDYVPSQAFTEFVRFQMKNKEGKSIDGIRYSSSRNGRPCVVLFCEHENCINAEPLSKMEQILRLKEGTLQQLTKEQFEEAIKRINEIESKKT